MHKKSDNPAVSSVVDEKSDDQAVSSVGGPKAIIQLYPNLWEE